MLFSWFTIPISLFEIINVVVAELKILFWISPSAADAAAVNPSGVKKFLASGLCTFFINSIPVFNNGPKLLTKNQPNCVISDSWVFLLTWY